MRMFSKNIFSFLSVLAFVLMSACSQSEVGTKKNPLKVMFIPYADQQTIMEHTDGLVKYLEKSLSQKMLGQDSGFYVTSSIPTFYISVVEAFGTERADLAAMTTFSYLLTKDAKAYPVESILTVVRDPDGEFYKGAIIARADSKVKKLEDINGKKFAFSDPASTSGFILASKLFKDKNISPSETVFAGRHDSVVTMVYQGQVDAGAIYYSSPHIRKENGKTTTEYRDARSMLIPTYPDIIQKVNVIAFTDEVPTEPWVLRTTIYQDPAKQAKLKKAIQDTIIEYGASAEGKEMMRLLVRAEKIIPAVDSRYDGLRKILKEVNFDIAKSVK